MILTAPTNSLIAALANGGLAISHRSVYRP
jgi:hypothetical protein